MLTRLDWMVAAPKVVLDLGCGTGAFGVRLQQRYPEAMLIALDNSLPMLEAASQVAPHRLCADGGVLPLPDQSVDLIFANLILPWAADMQGWLKEWRRVLRPDGILMLSMFGLDTMQELPSLCNTHPLRVDMHDAGEALVRAGFADPVLDVDYYTLTYRSQDKLITELRDTGMLAADAKILDPLPMTSEGLYPLTYEIIYAHAFAPQPASGFAPEEDGITRIPLSQLRQSLAKANKG